MAHQLYGECMCVWNLVVNRNRWVSSQEKRKRGEKRLSLGGWWKGRLGSSEKMKSWQDFGFFNHRLIYSTPGLATDRILLFQSKKGILAQNLAGLTERTLN